MLAHQSLDPVQSTGHAFGEQIVPHAWRRTSDR
jgi:hypothetical protein